MVKVSGGGFIVKGRLLFAGKDVLEPEETNKVLKKEGLAFTLASKIDKEAGRRGTIADGILRQHNQSNDPATAKLRFDALASHDITYVGIIQTARASGLKEFPVPYALTNCHNSLCAVGGTINEDDHVFGLSAARKYGGIYVPAHLAVIHQYVREMMTGCGKMILGSDSHTRYGAPRHHGGGRRRPGNRQAAFGPHLRRAGPRGRGGVPQGKAGPRRRAPGRRPRDHQGGLSRRAREEQDHGIRGSRDREPQRGFPERRRRHDHGDDLPLLDLGDGRQGRRMVQGPRQGRGVPAPRGRAGRLLRRDRGSRPRRG